MTLDRIRKCWATLASPSGKILTAMFGAFMLAFPMATSAQVTAVKGLVFTPTPLVSGTSTTIAPNTANAAVFKIHGILGVGGSFTFTLPTTMKHTDNVTTMPISFSATSASYRFGNSTPGGTLFNPLVGVSGLYIVVLTDIYIFVGGTLNPPLNQKSGSYTGTIVFTSSALL